MGHGIRGSAAMAVAALLVVAGVAACSAAGVRDGKTQGGAVGAVASDMPGASSPAAFGIPGASAGAASPASPGSTPTASPAVPAGGASRSPQPTSAPKSSAGVHLRPAPTFVAGSPHSPTPAAAALAWPSEITEADNGRTVQIALGATLTLVLHGMRWTSPGSSDASVLALTASPSFSAAGPIACTTGAACGSVTAVFVAVTAGEATITAGRTSCGDVLPCVGPAGSFAVTVRVGT